MADQSSLLDLLGLEVLDVRLPRHFEGEFEKTTDMGGEISLVARFVRKDLSREARRRKERKKDRKVSRSFNLIPKKREKRKKKKDWGNNHPSSITAPSKIWKEKTKERKTRPLRLFVVLDRAQGERKRRKKHEKKQKQRHSTCAYRPPCKIAGVGCPLSGATWVPPLSR